MTEPRSVAAVDIGATRTLVTRRALPVHEWRDGSPAAISMPTDRDPERHIGRIVDALGQLGGSIGLGRRRFVRTAVALARGRVMAETGRALVARPAALRAESR